MWRDSKGAGCGGTQGGEGREAAGAKAWNLREGAIGGNPVLLGSKTLMRRAAAGPGVGVLRHRGGRQWSGACARVAEAALGRLAAALT